jgi:hypothetical protein
MKFSIKILPLAILIFCSFAAAQTEDASASVVNTECKADVFIETDIPGSSIFINNRQVGKGSVSIELTKGRYFLSAVEDIEEWNSKVFNDSIEITECTGEKFSYKFSSGVYLKTEPQDVYVYSSDTLVGHTPLFLSDEISSVTLSKSGYQTKNLAVNQIYSGKPVKLDFVGTKDNGSFFQQDLFKILLGGLVVLGGTTAYFKLKADEKFEDYQFSGDQKLLDQTRKYDLISGITFTALQINFGVLIYYFLIE